MTVMQQIVSWVYQRKNLENRSQFDKDITNNAIALFFDSVLELHFESKEIFCCIESQNLPTQLTTLMWRWNLVLRKAERFLKSKGKNQQSDDQLY